MDENEKSFPGGGLPPMPGVKLPHNEEELKAAEIEPEREYPVGETLTLGDLIPPEGLPVPEFRDAEATEPEAEEPCSESEAEEPVADEEPVAEPEAEEEAPSAEESKQEPLPQPVIGPHKTNTLTRVLYVILQFTWGILQNICGAVTRLCVLLKNGKEAKMGCFHGAVMTRWNKSHSMGLGMFIFYGHKDAPDGENIKSHEYGHTVQSAWLGPLFLPVIGIPSYTWAFLPSCVKKRKEQGVKYCSFYPESWANALGEHVTGIPGPDR